jgi:hypothetical protein
MPIVRVDSEGEKVINRRARHVAAIAAAVVLIGVAVFLEVDRDAGILCAQIGTALAAVWNLADDS